MKSRAIEYRGKACRRHNIPVPPRGYWQRKAAGQKLRQTPLPRGKEPSDYTITLYGSNQERVADEVGATADSDTIHPLIAAERLPGSRRQSTWESRRVGRGGIISGSKTTIDGCHRVVIGIVSGTSASKDLVRRFQLRYLIEPEHLPAIGLT